MTLPPTGRLSARGEAAQRGADARRLDALLVTHPANIAYLTGFAGSSGALIVSGGRIQLISDGRYAEVLGQIGARLDWVVPVVATPVGRSIEETIAECLAALAPARVGFEAGALTVLRHRDLVARLEALAPGTDWLAADGVVEDLREVKDPWEQDTLREAGRRLSSVAKCIIPKILAGISERELAAHIDGRLRREGFDKPAFDTIVASGPNAAEPHHRAGDRLLATGDLVVVDFGGMFRGYAVDMTRTVAIGGMDEAQRRAFRAVAEAQRAAFRTARVGTAGDDVDEAARNVLVDAGFGEAFSHGLGHGLGLEVHERPRLARRRPGAPLAALAAGMVFTLEPGVYVPGWGGVRIEDDVLLTDRGPEWLTDPIDEVRAT